MSQIAKNRLVETKTALTEPNAAMPRAGKYLGGWLSRQIRLYIQLSLMYYKIDIQIYTDRKIMRLL